MSKNENKITQVQENYPDTVIEWLPVKNAIDPLASYGERVRMACELSGKQIYKTDKRLVERKEKRKDPPAGWEFDR